MSRFTGKCDFSDKIEIIGLSGILSSQIYVGDRATPLDLKSYKDCIPYLSHIVSSSAFCNCIGKAWLTEKSWLDICEERYKKPIIEYNYMRMYLAEEYEKYDMSGVISKSPEGDTISYEKHLDGYVFVERDKDFNVLVIKPEYSEDEVISALRIQQNRKGEK